MRGARGLQRIAVAGIFSALTAAGSWAAQGPEIRIARVDPAKGPIEIDGDLSDAAWKDAAPITDWVETNPGDNVPPKVRSVAWLTYDDKFLYAAFEFDEPDPSTIRAPYGDRDNVASYTDYGGIIVDSGKLVARLGAFPVPIEVLPFAGAWVMRALGELHGTATRRHAADGSPFHTDQGNVIFDTAFGLIEDAAALAGQLSQVPGIVEHGLFLDEIDTVFIGRPGGVDVRRRGVVP